METLSTNINAKSLKILKKLRIQLGFEPRMYIVAYMIRRQLSNYIHMYKKIGPLSRLSRLAPIANYA